MRDVADAVETAQQNSTAAASAVVNVLLILLPKRPDRSINASSVPWRRRAQIIEITG